MVEEKEVNLEGYRKEELSEESSSPEQTKEEKYPKESNSQEQQLSNTEKNETEDAIDLKEIKNKTVSFFKKIKGSSDKKKVSEHSERSDQPLKTEEKNQHKEEKPEEAIDFKDIKNKTISFFKNIKKNYNKSEHSTSKDDESFDLSKIKTFWNKHSNLLIPFLLIFLAIFTSSYFRMMPSDLPITDGWATNSVHNFFRNQVTNQINQQYPNLPDSNKNALIEREVQKQLEQNKDQIDTNINQISTQYKTYFQDDNGHTYLLAIDPYLWYSQARNVIRHGHLGDKIIDGESYYSLRNGRLDKKTSTQLHPYFAAYLYKILHFFNNDITIMRALFLMPVILIGLALIPAFFIGRMIGGNVGGFFAAMFLALNGPLLGRTPAGFADTDPYNVLFPLFIAWFFLEAYRTDSLKNKLLFSCLSGFFIGVYAATWGGWSYIFLFVLATIGITILLKLGVEIYKNNFKLSKHLINHVKPYFHTLLFILISTGIFVTSFHSFRMFWKSFIRPFQFMALKQVGVVSVWPNVLTTVAEFNRTSFTSIINQMGGNIFFSVSVLGIILTLLIKDKRNKREFAYFVLLTIWVLSTAYAFTKGTRFAILIAPAFALGIGSTFGVLYKKGAEWLHKGIYLNQKISKPVILILLFLTLMTPLSTANSIGRNEVPSMNDDWYNALIKIRDDSTDAIITSWWDFGHWFQSISERRVTFDGGDQGRRIHWVGKSLLSNNEKQANGILRMLNCGQQSAPEHLTEYLDSDLKAVRILDEIFQTDSKEEAREKYLEYGLNNQQTETMLKYTHCSDLIPNYYITSQDMIGKAGVWGHFGSWDFEKATMYFNTRKMSRENAVDYLSANFDLDEQAASQLHSEIQNADADRWISPWPGYITGLNGCSRIGKEEVRCGVSFQGKSLSMIINLNSYNVTIENNPSSLRPNSITYATKDDVKIKHFLEGPKTGFSVVLVPNGDNYQLMVTDPLLANSIFTRLFFFNGHGLKCFSNFDDRNQVTGGRIATWKIDFDCKQENKIFFLEPEVEEEVIEEIVIDEVEETIETEDSETSENFSEEETVSDENTTSDNQTASDNSEENLETDETENISNKDETNETAEGTNGTEVNESS